LRLGIFCRSLLGEFLFLLVELFIMVNGEINPVAVLADGHWSVVCGSCGVDEGEPPSVAFVVALTMASSLPPGVGQEAVLSAAALSLPLGGGQLISSVGAIEISACGSCDSKVKRTHTYRLSHELKLGEMFVFD